MAAKSTRALKCEEISEAVHIIRWALRHSPKIQRLLPHDEEIRDVIALTLANIVQFGVSTNCRFSTNIINHLRWVLYRYWYKRKRRLEHNLCQEDLDVREVPVDCNPALLAQNRLLVAEVLYALRDRARWQQALLCKLKGMTLDETAKVMGITRERVRQILKKAYELIREEFPELVAQPESQTEEDEDGQNHYTIVTDSGHTHVRCSESL